MRHQRRFNPGAALIRRERLRAWRKGSLTTVCTWLPVFAAAGIVLSLAISRPVMAKPVTQGKWAQLLVRSMGIEEKVATPGADPQRFIEFLAGEPVPTIRIQGVLSDPWPAGALPAAPEGTPERAWIRVGKKPAKALYRVRVSQSGIYAIRFSGTGDVQRWHVSGTEPRDVKPVPGNTKSHGPVDDLPTLVGYFILARGDQEIEVAIPSGGGLEAFELIRQPFPHVRPPEGWRPDATLTYAVKAVTMIQAMQLQHELPDLSKWRVQREGEAYDAEPDPAFQTKDGSPGMPSAGSWVQGKGKGSWLVYRVNILKEGTYSLIARVTGEGRGIFLLDRQIEREWEAPGSDDRFLWRPILTVPLSKGMHRIDVNLEENAGLDVLRLLYRDPDPEESLMLLKDLGYEESFADNFVSMAGAEENLANADFQKRIGSLMEGFFTQSGTNIGPPPGPVPLEFPELILPSDDPPPETRERMSPD